MGCNLEYVSWRYSSIHILSGSGKLKMRSSWYSSIKKKISPSSTERLLKFEFLKLVEVNYRRYKGGGNTTKKKLVSPILHETSTCYPQEPVYRQWRSNGPTSHLEAKLPSVTKTRGSQGSWRNRTLQLRRNQLSDGKPKSLDARRRGQQEYRVPFSGIKRILRKGRIMRAKHRRRIKNRRRRRRRNKIFRRKYPVNTFASLNLRGCVDLNKQIDVLNTIHEHHPDVMLLCGSETRKKGSGNEEVLNILDYEKPFKVYYSGLTDPKVSNCFAGVNIIIFPHCPYVINKVVNMNERIMFIDFHRDASGSNEKLLRVISTYSPTNCNYSSRAKRAYYRQLTEVINEAKSLNIDWILLGDMNAKFDIRDYSHYPKTFGRFGYNNEQNENGDLLLEHCLKWKASIINTFYRINMLKRSFYSFRYSNKSKKETTLDYAILETKALRFVNNCYLIANLPTLHVLDHALLKVKFRLIINIFRKKLVKKRAKSNKVYPLHGILKGKELKANKPFDTQALIHDKGDVRIIASNCITDARIDARNQMRQGVISEKHGLDHLQFTILCHLRSEGLVQSEENVMPDFNEALDYRIDQSQGGEGPSSLRFKYDQNRKIFSDMMKNSKNIGGNYRLSKEIKIQRKLCNKLGRLLKFENDELYATKLSILRQCRDPLHLFLSFDNRCKPASSKTIEKLFSKSKGHLVFTPEEICEVAKDHVYKLLNKTSIAIQDVKLVGESIPTNDDLISEITLIEVVEVLKDIPMNKSGGLGPEDEGHQSLGDLPLEFWKYAADEATLQEVIFWFNKILTEMYIPLSFIVSVCIFLFKKGDASDCDNYRSLCLNNHMYKWFIKVMYNRIYKHCELHNIISESQNGFRYGRSCNDANTILRTIKALARKYGIDLHIGYIDIKKAYDSVDRVLLWRILLHIGIPQRLIDILRKLYDDNEICISINGEKSEYFKTTIGLKQGCPLSPLLFAIYFEFVFRLVREHGTPLNKNCGIKIKYNMKRDDIIGPRPGSDQQYGELSDYIFGDVSSVVEILETLFADDSAVYSNDMKTKDDKTPFTGIINIENLEGLSSAKVRERLLKYKEEIFAGKGKSFKAIKQISHKFNHISLMFNLEAAIVKTEVEFVRNSEEANLKNKDGSYILQYPQIFLDTREYILQMWRKGVYKKQTKMERKQAKRKVKSLSSILKGEKDKKRINELNKEITKTLSQEGGCQALVDTSCFKYLGLLTKDKWDKDEALISRGISLGTAKMKIYSEGLYRNAWIDKLSKLTHLCTSVIPTVAHGIEVWCIDQIQIKRLDSWLYEQLLIIFGIRRRNHISLATLIGRCHENNVRIYPFRILLAGRRIKYHACIQRMENFRLPKMVHNGTIVLNREDHKVKNSLNWRSKTLVRDSLIEDLALLNLQDFEKHLYNEKLFNELISRGVDKALQDYFLQESNLSMERREKEKRRKQRENNGNNDDIPVPAIRRNNRRIEMRIDQSLNTTKRKSREYFKKAKEKTREFESNWKFNNRFIRQNIKRHKNKNHYNSPDNEDIQDERGETDLDDIFSMNKYYHPENIILRTQVKKNFGRPWDNIFKGNGYESKESIWARNLQKARETMTLSHKHEGFIQVVKRFDGSEYKLKLIREKKLNEENLKKQDPIVQQQERNYILEHQNNPEKYCAYICKTGRYCDVKKMEDTTMCPRHHRMVQEFVEKQRSIRRCKSIMNSGDRKGEVCDAIIKDQTKEFCGRHLKGIKGKGNSKEKEVDKKVPVKHCFAMIKTGKRKDHVCGNPIFDQSKDFCGIHSRLKY